MPLLAHPFLIILKPYCPAPPHPGIPRLGTGSERGGVKECSHISPICSFIIVYDPCLSQPLTGGDFFCVLSRHPFRQWCRIVVSLSPLHPSTSFPNPFAGSSLHERTVVSGCGVSQTMSVPLIFHQQQIIC